MIKYEIEKDRGHDVDIAVANILDGNIVVFPTETVYGIGANVFDIDAINKIFKAKNRPSDNPIIVHIGNMGMLKNIVNDITEMEQKLIDNFFPGPFSIILNKNENISNVITGNLDTVAVRMPNNALALEFINKCNVPIAAPSANVSTKPSGTNIDDIYEELNGRVSYFLEGQNSKIGIESTVVRVMDNVVHILRPGYITKEDIEQLGFEVNMNNKLKISPGMKYKHYAPDVECILVTGNYIAKLNNLKGDNICVMVEDRNVSKIRRDIPVINLGKTYEEIAKKLFSNLRKVDSMNVSKCYIQSLEDNGIGVAIMNRLIKTCGDKTI